MQHESTIVQPSSGLMLPASHDRSETGKWRVMQLLDCFDADIDQYRKRYGKAAGEVAFFRDHSPSSSVCHPGNLLLLGGVSTLFEMAIGNGSGTAGNALCWFDNTNAVLGVGDSTTTESISQVDLQASTNKYYQGMDASYPLHSDATGATGTKTITGATNASPIAITSTSHGYSTGDIVFITGVGGNTAPNDALWQITVTDANTYTLNGSTGSGTYTSGGLSMKANVLVFKATVGASNANYAWNEWVVKNGTGGSSRCLNRKVSSLGTKSSGTWALTVGIGLY